MKILSIEIVNNKKLRCFNVAPNGENVEVAGDTGSGKTTAISALWDIITKGGDTLTHGESKGRVKVKLGDGSDTWIEAERVTTKKTSTISIQKFICGKPIDILPKDFEKMLSSLSVNPHKIIDMKPTEKVKTLLKAASVTVDLDALEQEITEAEQERLSAKRAVEAIKPGEEPEKAEPVSVSELVSKRDAIVARNDIKKKAYGELEELVERKTELEIHIDSLKTQLAEAEADLAGVSARVTKGEAWKETPKGQLESTDELTQQISSAEETNSKAAVYAKWVERSKEEELLDDAHKVADAKVKELRAKKQAALDTAKWPLKGLCVTDGEITYNGILLENLGESEQILVTAAIALGDIERHPLKVCRMDGVESMSKKDYDQLKKLFNGKGVQILSTRVSRGDTEPGEIVIVDGVYDETKKTEE